MKKTIATLAIFLSSIVIVHSQNSDSITLKDLEVPNSPGFILLDKTPTTIERPNSSKAFMVSALNSFTDNSGLPQNYAIDFTPFWFFKHPKMTSFKYMGYDKEKDKQKVFKDFKKASISFAFVNTTDTLTKKQINNISIGVRTNLLSVRSKKDIQDFKNANTKVVLYLKSLEEEMTANGITAMLYISNKEEYDTKLKEFLSNKEQDSISAKNNLKNILNRRAVFAIDGAAGYNSLFKNDNFNSNQFGRFGAWLTMNYSQNLNRTSGERNYLNLYALGRYLSDGTTNIGGKYVIQNFYDYGGKLEIEFKNLSIGYEYIYRINNNMNSFRSNGIVKYKISDQLFLTGAFGKNFGNNDNLISLLGLNWGLLSGTEQPKVMNE